MKAEMDPATGEVSLKMAEEEWLPLPHYTVEWAKMTPSEDAALRALLKVAGQPEGYTGP